MYKLTLYQTKKGLKRWLWKATFTQGNINRTLARSGETYASKANALRAFQNLWHHHFKF